MRFIPLLNLYMWPGVQASGPFFAMTQVSIIIPVYNREKLLIEAVESVLSQTLGNFELILVDDGSTDKTPETMQFLSGKDRRIKTIYLEHSGYPGRVRNEALRQVSSPYLAFLDSDDLWEPQKLSRQCAELFSSGLRISHTREKWLRGDRIVSQKSQRHQRNGDLFRDSLVKCILGPSTVLMETALFKETNGFREDLEIAEDYEFWIRITARERIHFLDEALTVKRAGFGDHLSEKYGQIEVFRIQALRDLWFSQSFKPEQRAALREELARKTEIYIKGCRKRGKEAEASAYEELIQSL